MAGRVTTRLVALPLILGFHQFVEAFVWLSLQGHISPGIGRFAMWVYVSIAFVLLPVFVPIAVFVWNHSETAKAYGSVHRARPAVGGILLAAMIRGP